MKQTSDSLIFFNQDDGTTKNFLGISGWFVGLGAGMGDGHQEVMARALHEVKRSFYLRPHVLSHKQRGRMVPLFHCPSRQDPQ